MFSEHHVENLLNLIGGTFPAVNAFLTSELGKQKQKLFDPEFNKHDNPSITATIWNYMIYLMIGYFVYSFINSIV